LPRSSAHTVGGYVFERLDHLPAVGDHISLGSYRLTVEELDGRRIARIRVRPEGGGEHEAALKSLQV
jgi:putative hemolysin